MWHPESCLRAWYQPALNDQHHLIRTALVDIRQQNVKQFHMKNHCCSIIRYTKPSPAIPRACQSSAGESKTWHRFSKPGTILSSHQHTKDALCWPPNVRPLTIRCLAPFPPFPPTNVNRTVPGTFTPGIFPRMLTTRCPRTNHSLPGTVPAD